MPSAIHNVLVELIESHPEVLAYLLALHGAAPEGPLIPTTGTRTRTITLERRVDRAFVVGSRREPESFLLAEVQLEPDEDKRFSWPLYLEIGRTRYHCCVNSSRPVRLAEQRGHESPARPVRGPPREALAARRSLRSPPGTTVRQAKTRTGPSAGLAGLSFRASLPHPTSLVP